MTLEELAGHRREILRWEVAGLMHDIGKLSDEFLYYRQNWHAMEEAGEEGSARQWLVLRGKGTDGERRAIEFVQTVSALANSFRVMQLPMRSTIT